MSDTPNTLVTSNVMVPRDMPEDLRVLPGDFAVMVYGKTWVTPQWIRKNLTDRQWIEYTQYMICELCGRPCAGTCGLGPVQHGR